MPKGGMGGWWSILDTSDKAQLGDELVEIGKTVRDYKLGTVANFSSATLDTARNMAEKVGYLVQL